MRPKRLRVVHNISYRKAASEWYGVIHSGWNWALYRPDRVMKRLIASGSTEQRTVLGFPPPGSDYWCEATLEAVEARSGGLAIDLSEVRAALATR